MQPIRLDLDVADESDNGIAANLTGVGPWTSANFTASGPSDSLAHQISLASTANLSAINITITGTDADGNTQSETRAGPNNNEVETSKYFKTITSISAASTLGANTMNVGWVDEVASPTMGLNPNSSRPAAIAVRQAGTANWKLQTTAADLDPSRATGAYAFTDQESLAFADDSGITNKSATFNGVFSAAYQTAFRIIYNSYSSGAELQVWVNQGK